VKFQEDEKLTALVAARNLEDADKFRLHGTKSGTVKKSALAEFSNPRSTGIIAVTLDGKDELIGAKLTDGKKMIFPGQPRGAGDSVPRNGSRLVKSIAVHAAGVAAHRTATSSFAEQKSPAPRGGRKSSSASVSFAPMSSSCHPR